MSVEQLVEQKGKTSQKGATTEKTNTKDREIEEVYTNVFMEKGGLGALNEKSEVDIKPMRVFLEDATRNVLEVMKTDPSIVPEYAREIVRMVSKGKSSETLTPQELHNNAVEALKSDRMKELVRKWQDQELYYRSFALAFHWATDPEADRKNMATEETVHTGKGEGALHKGVRNINEYVESHPMLREALEGLAVAAAAGQGALNITGRPDIAALVMGGTLVAEGGFVTVRSLTTAGEREIKSFCSDALRMIQSDKALARYIKAVSGVDAFDFVPGPNNQITLASGVPESRRVAAVEAEVKKGVEDRRQFWADLGATQTDAMPNQFIYRYRGGAPEQTGSRIEKRIQELFKPNTDGFKDTANQSPTNPFFGRINTEAVITAAGNVVPANITNTNFAAGARIGIDRDQWGQDPRNPYYGRVNITEVVNTYLNQPFDTINIPGATGINALRVRSPLANPNLPDIWGQVPGNPFYGRLDGTGLTAQIDTEGNLRRYDQAYQQAMLEEFREISQEIQRGNYKKDAELFNTKAGEREKGKPIYNAREQEINERQGRIEADKTAIEGEKETITTYQSKIEELNQKRKEYEQAFEDVKDTSGATYASPADAITELTKIRDVLTGSVPPPRITIDGELFESIQDIRKTEVDRHDSEMRRLATLTGKNVGELKANEMTYHKDRLEEIRQQREQINQRIKRLRELPKEIEDKEKEVADTEEVVKEAVKNLEGREQDYKDLMDVRTTAGGFDPGRYLTERDLREKSMEYIMGQINKLHTISTTRAAFTPYPPYGWPAEDKNRPENRMKVERAIMEARARKIEPAVDTNAADPDFQIVIKDASSGGYELTENQLRTLTRDEIIALVDASRRWPASITTLAQKQAQIEKAQDIADRRMRARIRATNEQIQAVTKWSNGLDRDKEKLEETLRPEKETLEVTANLMSNIDKLFDLSYEITTNPTQYLNSTVIRPGGGTTNANFTPAENALNAPEGYYEMLDTIFGYRKSPQRETEFRKLSTVLSQAKLARLLNESLYPRSRTTPNFDVLLNKIRRDLTRTPTPSLDYMRIQQAFDHVVETVYNEALALP